MTADELEILARYRPNVELRDPDGMLERILADAVPGAAVVPLAARRRRRTGALVGLAAAAVIAAVVVPAALPSASPGSAAPAAAAELRRLAVAATTSIDPPLAAGTFRHQIVTQRQADPEMSSTLESWTDVAGQQWRRDTTVYADGTPDRSDTYLFEGPSDPSLAQFPTQPDELQRYLMANASGSTSTDEAVFSRLADLLRYSGVPAAQRSAAAEVLARTGHVSLGPRTTDSFGRLVQEVSFVEEVGRPGEVQALVFDTADARVTAERITTSEHTDLPYYESTVTPADVTDSVPADVLRDALLVDDADADPVTGG